MANRFGMLLDVGIIVRMNGRALAEEWISSRRVFFLPRSWSRGAELFLASARADANDSGALLLKLLRKHSLPRHRHASRRSYLQTFPQAPAADRLEHRGA